MFKILEEIPTLSTLNQLMDSNLVPRINILSASSIRKDFWDLNMEERIIQLKHLLKTSDPLTLDFEAVIDEVEALIRARIWYRTWESLFDDVIWYSAKVHPAVIDNEPPKFRKFYIWVDREAHHLMTDDMIRMALKEVVAEYPNREVYVQITRLSGGDWKSNEADGGNIQ